MHPLILLSIVLRVWTTVRAVAFWRRMRDRRILLFAVLFGTMVVRQTATVLVHPGSWQFWSPTSLSEMPALLVSVLGALAMVYVEQFVVDQRRNASQLRRINRALRVLSGFGRVLREAADERALLERLCRTVVESGGYRMAWVGFPEDDDLKTVRQVASAGEDAGYLEKLKVTWGDGRTAQGPTGTSIRTGRPSVTRSVPMDERFAPWRENAMKSGFMAVIGLPIRVHGAVIGAVTIYSATGDSFDADEEKLLVELVDDLASGIENRRVKAAALAGEEERKRLISILEVTDDFVSTAAPDGRVLDYNLGARRMRGLADGPVEARIRDNHPPWAAELIEEVGIPFAVREGVWTGETAILGPGGGEVPVSQTILVHRAADGSVEYLSTICRDITALKRIEREIKTLNEELERRVKERTAELAATNSELESFAYSVSHDLRAPLRHIDGYMDLLRKGLGEMGAKERHYMDSIADAVKKMGALIDDLLAFSRLGRSELKKKTVSLAALAEQARRELRTETEGRDVRWRVADLPTVQADETMLRSVFANLFGNAVKFSRSKSPAIIEVGSEVARGEAVVWVRDNGVGFDMRYKEKLFGVFSRLHGAGEFEGTGIGLANVQRLVARHGGRAWAEGEVGRGATFYFSLPLEGTT